MSSPQFKRKVLCGLNSSVAQCNPVAVACARLRLALLDQETASVVADGFQPIPPTALRANEVHPEAIDVRLDLAETGENLLAANALEHAGDVPGAHDRTVTPTTLANVTPPSDLRTLLPRMPTVAKGSPRLLRNELPGNLVSVMEGLFHGTEPLALFVAQYASRVMRAVDRFDQHVTRPEVPDLNSIPDALVLAGLHVLLEAAHVRLVLAPDRPILFESVTAVNTPLPFDPELLRGIQLPHA